MSTIENLLQEISYRYPFQWNVAESWQDRMVFVSCLIKHPRELGKKWEGQRSISDEKLQSSLDPEALLWDELEKLAESTVQSVPEEEIGAYPFARLWFDIHHPNLPHLLFHPDREVLGWVFSKAYKNYPKDGPRKKKEATMADGTKKRVVRRAPAVAGFDYKKIKPPECNVHLKEMSFDVLEQKWRCPEDGCRVVARPKRDADDKTVLLGKGEVNLRVIAQKGRLSVVLISDDNIALDITPMFDVKQVVGQGIAEQAEQAAQDGVDFFNIEVAKPFIIKPKVTVLGAQEVVEWVRANM